MSAACAGYMAETLFDCPAHESVAAEDRKRIAELLKGMSESQFCDLEREGEKCAIKFLQVHRNKVLMLVERLVKDGYVNGREFSRLMQGKA